jgi:hypothetical protein
MNNEHEAYKNILEVVHGQRLVSPTILELGRMWRNPEFCSCTVTLSKAPQLSCLLMKDLNFQYMLCGALGVLRSIQDCYG